MADHRIVTLMGAIGNSNELADELLDDLVAASKFLLNDPDYLPAFDKLVERFIKKVLERTGFSAEFAEAAEFGFRAGLAEGILIGAAGQSRWELE